MCLSNLEGESRVDFLHHITRSVDSYVDHSFMQTKTALFYVRHHALFLLSQF